MMSAPGGWCNRLTSNLPHLRRRYHNAAAIAPWGGPSAGRYNLRCLDGPASCFRRTRQPPSPPGFRDCRATFLCRDHRPPFQGGLPFWAVPPHWTACRSGIPAAASASLAVVFVIRPHIDRRRHSVRHVEEGRDRARCPRCRGRENPAARSAARSSSSIEQDASVILHGESRAWPGAAARGPPRASSSPSTRRAPDRRRAAAPPRRARRDNSSSGSRLETATAIISRSSFDSPDGASIRSL